MKELEPRKSLDEQGRCCGRKPTAYKLPKHRLWCSRCHREFDPVTKGQVENWAWQEVDRGMFLRL